MVLNILLMVDVSESMPSCPVTPQPYPRHPAGPPNLIQPYPRRTLTLYHDLFMVSESTPSCTVHCDLPTLSAPCAPSAV
eukprot:2418457-Rhodomonas_salina.2